MNQPMEKIQEIFPDKSASIKKEKTEKRKLDCIDIPDEMKQLYILSPGFTWYIILCGILFSLAYYICLFN